jgi:hypothetical protein
MKTKEERAEAARQVIAGATGTEHWYRYWMGPMLYTDGVKGLAEAAGAYWLIDLIMSYQTGARRKAAPFQVWTLKVRQDGTAVAEMRQDSDRPAEITQEIPSTDFPLDEVQLYLCDNVLLLPGEY